MEDQAEDPPVEFKKEKKRHTTGGSARGDVRRGGGAWRRAAERDADGSVRLEDTRPSSRTCLACQMFTEIKWRRYSSEQPEKKSGRRSR